MLRKLIKGEKVLVIDRKLHMHGFQIGELVEVLTGEDCGTLRVGNERIDWQALMREQLLAIGDKVVRGPDWDYGGQDKDGVGTVMRFLDETYEGFNIAVKWNRGGDQHYRMNAEHQDLKPTGDSKVEEDDKPGCFGSEDCPDQHTCDCWGECRESIELYNEQKTISKEDTMTREQRAKNRDKDIETSKEVIEAKKEEIAQAEENIAQFTEEAANLRKYKTDKEENIVLVCIAKGVDKKQAKAMLALADKEIEV